ncbi:glycoside hydrolase family 3 protein [Streptomyces sp. WMMC897]|uniref:glycoside hydrolase family 3 protein n=1 Tax=Streptomyces sp. WMMC897 TaxID=3014782 RepID=UPI0022B6EE33|nr:glycoside hydrolase family 3 protein [Streptomyces sp. WMMC897]MCZ7414369.1 glycoside hydrolase family 3 protein [Streptomyces sp. WMMC897]
MHDGRQQPKGRFRRSLTALAAAGALLLTAAPALAGDGGPGDAGARDGGGDDTARWVDGQLDRMTLEEKVGQLFVTYAYGETADTTDPDDVARNQRWLGVDNGAEAVAEYHLGGVIYFAWSDNLREPHQVAGLSDGLQRAALDSGTDVPLLISTDQEHGIVTRLGPPATQFPGNMALGASGRAGDAREAARIAGRELRAVGINQNYAPVADVNVNAANPVIGVRSFSGDPDLAAELTAAQVKGYQSGGENGVAATAKHFPGHGDTNVDSHTDLPVIHHTLKEWRTIDAPPFAEAVEAGVGAVMTAHIQFPELDPSGAPATLSEPIMTGLLREELDYDGVVVTDSLSMAGVRETYPDAEVPVRALRAGVDLLLMPPDLPTAYDAVLDAVASGELTEERIDRSVRRVLTLKHERGIVERPFADVTKVAERVGPPHHLAAAQRITDRTTTLVKNDDGLLPLAADGRSVLVTGWGSTTTARLAGHLDDRGVTATAHWAGSNPGADAVEAAVAAAEGHDTVVVTTRGTATAPGQARLVRALLETGKPVVTLAVGRPYDIARYPEAATHLATYSYGAGALESAARVLLGETAPQGTLPVMIPTAENPEEPLFPLGHGLGYER